MSWSALLLLWLSTSLATGLLLGRWLAARDRRAQVEPPTTQPRDVR